MSDAFGQQRVAPTPFRVSRQHAPVPNLSPGADDHVDDLAAAYALGALDESERDLVDFHIRFCPRCAALVESDLRTVGHLPYLSPPATPRPEAKAALFVRVAQEGPRPATVVAAPLGALDGTGDRRPGTVDRARRVPGVLGREPAGDAAE